MTDAKHQRLRRLFDQALEMPFRARESFLDDKCHGDLELKQRLHAMLMAADDEHIAPTPSTPHQEHAQPGARTATPATAPAPSSAPATEEPLREGPGTHLGPYKLLQQIGEGGFGVVFMAQQEQPVMRRVALKIIKLGMDTRQVVARFEQERQALALMDHPNIARVLDAGATETGRPYFVMDLVKGDPIIAYCDKHNLRIDERLELFAQVCHAVQHAHSKGIIHRDLKPSNILVATQDGKPHAKVIDFGIAKATFSRLTKKTLFTEHQQVIGTLQYMSPEQAEGSLDIDTRTDVYSLGVMLYELLTGSTPHDEKTAKAALFGELRRMIREVDPPRPSTRLHESSDTLASIAAHRGVEPRRLGTLVRGELDWIVMKALEKDRSRRYETANGLAADLRRYLAGEDVVAAPPSASYRLRKFVRRNKGTVGAVAAVGAALLVGVIAFAWQARVASEQRDLAVRAQLAEAEQHRRADAERDRAIAAEAKAQIRADEIGRVSDFQAAMLSQIDTNDAGARLFAGLREKFGASLQKSDIAESERMARNADFERDLALVNATDTAAALIDNTILRPATKAIDLQFRDQPTVGARLQNTLAELLLGLGFYDAAQAQAQLALATRSRVLGDDHPDTLTSLNVLASILEAENKLPQAEQCFRDVLARRRAQLGDDHPDTIRSMMSLGNLLRGRGAYAEAEPFLRGAVEKFRTVLGNEHRDTLIAMNCLGFLFATQGNFTETEPLWREAYETGRRTLGEDNTDVLVWMNNLAGLLTEQGKQREAEAYHREAVAKYRRIRGDEHPSTLEAIGAMANFLSAQGRLAEAEPLYREALAMSRHVLGPSHPITLMKMSGLGRLLAKLDRIDEAELLLRECLAVDRRVFGEEHPDTLVRMTELANLFRQVNRPDEAEPLARKALAGWLHIRGPDDGETLVAQSSLGMVLEQQGKLADAELVDREAMTKLRAVRGDGHPTTINSIVALANVLRKRGRNTEAEPLYRAALSRGTSKLALGHSTLGHAHLGLGLTLTELRRFAEAEPELLAAAQVFAAAGGGSARMSRSAVGSLVSMYTLWQELEPGEDHDLEAAKWRATQAAMGLQAAPTESDTGK